MSLATTAFLLAAKTRSKLTPTGTLFRFNGDLSRHTMRTSLGIPNGIGWSQDQKTLYFTHSSERRIYAFNYEASTGDLTNERIFYQHPTEGEPDGFKMDSEGNIWQAIYGEGKVLKINSGGKVVGEVSLVYFSFLSIRHRDSL